MSLNKWATTKEIVEKINELEKKSVNVFSIPYEKIYPKERLKAEDFIPIYKKDV